MQRLWPFRFRSHPTPRLRLVLVPVLMLAVTLYVVAGASGGGGEHGEASAVKPRLGKTVVVAPVSGEVFVRKPNGQSFQLLNRREIPLHSIVGTRHGKVRLASRRGRKGPVQSGVFSGGRFEVTQPVLERKRGLTVLTLRAKLGCRRTRSAGDGRAEASRGKQHKLTGRAKGKYRTEAGKGVGTVRGTVWDTIRTCNATKFVVRRGKLEVARIVTDGRGRFRRRLRGVGTLFRARGRRHSATIRG
jgi:hypothetical protein